MVLFTLENIVGSEIIKHGLKLFLTNQYVFIFSSVHICKTVYCSKYSSATGHDLWDSFQKSLGNTSTVFPQELNLITVMETWEHQAGIPVLNVNITHDSIEFSQVCR